MKLMYAIQMQELFRRVTLHVDFLKPLVQPQTPNPEPYTPNPESSTLNP